MAVPKEQIPSPLPTADVVERHYSNDGNRPLIELLETDHLEVLDIGCGAGDNARLSKQLGFDRQFFGITRSNSELASASKFMTDCWLEDIETSSLVFLGSRRFDALVFSHVLEHLNEPWTVVAKFVRHLRPGGVVLIAVPNVLTWRQRIEFLRGRFQYQEAGLMDVTHLRFFTFDSADSYLLKETPSLKLEKKIADGSVPLWFLRHHLLTDELRGRLDNLGCTWWPNLFAGQTLIKARLSSEPHLI